MATIFIEIDGIVSDNNHRMNHKNDYETYQEMSEDDEVKRDFAELILCLSDYYEIVLFSMRNERFRLVTEEWLRDNDIAYDHLILRSDSDYTPEVELCYEMVLDHFGGKQTMAMRETSFIFCNHERSVELLREEGFKVCMTEW